MGEIKRPLNAMSGGDASITFPDVCKTPAPPAPFAPVPYPNIQFERNLKKASKVDALALTGDRNAIALQKKAVSNLVMSQGDEAGTLKGVTSASQAVRMGHTLHKGGVGKPQAGIGTAIKMGLSVYANGRELKR